jgi:hypothetical protein
VSYSSGDKKILEAFIFKCLEIIIRRDSRSPRKENSGISKESFNEELEQVF